jgi:hypothetical protein
VGSLQTEWNKGRGGTEAGRDDGCRERKAVADSHGDYLLWVVDCDVASVFLLLLLNSLCFHHRTKEKKLDDVFLLLVVPVEVRIILNLIGCKKIFVRSLTSTWK